MLPATVVSLFLICALLEYVRRLLSRLFRIPKLFGAASDKLCSVFRRLMQRFLPPEE